MQGQAPEMIGRRKSKTASNRLDLRKATRKRYGHRDTAGNMESTETISPLGAKLLI